MIYREPHGFRTASGPVSRVITGRSWGDDETLYGDEGAREQAR